MILIPRYSGLFCSNSPSKFLIQRGCTLAADLIQFARSPRPGNELGSGMNLIPAFFGRGDETFVKKYLDDRFRWIYLLFTSFRRGRDEFSRDYSSLFSFCCLDICEFYESVDGDSTMLLSSDN